MPLCMIEYKGVEGSFKVAMGDFEPFVITGDDLVVGYGEQRLSLYPAELVGFSPSYCAFGGEVKAAFSPVLWLDPENKVRIYGNELTVEYNSNSSLVWTFGFDGWESIHGSIAKISYDEVTVSWFESTNYYEYKVPCNNRLYFIPDTEPIRLDGELSKNSYAVFDLSQVENGLYCIGGYWGGIIEVRH